MISEEEVHDSRASEEGEHEINIEKTDEQSSQHEAIENDQSNSQEQDMNSAMADNGTNDDNTETSESEKGPTSSFENIIPVNKLKNGWLQIAGLMSYTVDVVKEKSKEAYESEPVTRIRRKSIEGWEYAKEQSTPVWEKTKNAAAPVWEKTKELTTPVWETTKTSINDAYQFTKEKSTAVAETAIPMVSKMSQQLSEGAAATWIQTTGEISRVASQLTKTNTGETNPDVSLDGVTESSDAVHESEPANVETRASESS